MITRQHLLLGLLIGALAGRPGRVCAAGGLAPTASPATTTGSLVFDPLRQGVVHTPQMPGASPQSATVTVTSANNVLNLQSQNNGLAVGLGSYAYPVNDYPDQEIIGGDVPIQRNPPESRAVLVDPAYERGREWGQDLRREVVHWEPFVGYCKDSLLHLDDPTRALFQRGFAAGYGPNADAAWQKALDQARTLAAAPAPPLTVVSPYGVVQTH